MICKECKSEYEEWESWSISLCPLCNEWHWREWEIEERENLKRIDELQVKGHSQHCACHIVWGDGECTCDLERAGYDPYAWQKGEKAWVVAECKDCAWRTEDFLNGRTLAAKHAKHAKHEVKVEVGLVFDYDGRQQRDKDG